MRYIELEISGYQFDDYVFQLSIFLKFQVHAVKITKRKVCPSLIHTASSDTIFVQIYMDPPPGVPGVSNDAPESTKHDF